MIKFLKSKKNELKIAAIFSMVAVMLVFTILWAWNDYMTSPPYVDPQVYPIRGIDISAHNGMMNLEGAADDGIEFVFIKLTEGKDFRDSNFRINYDKAARAGLKIGVYHFFRFDRDGVSQAVNLLKSLGNRKLDLGIAVDVEKEGNPPGIPIDSITDRLQSMVDILNMKGYRVIFYSNTQGYYDYLSQNFKGYPLWICSFSSNPINEEWTFWQFNHHGKVKGINGDVDINVFNGSRKQWEDFLKAQRR